jgi:hypothetical protein
MSMVLAKTPAVRDRGRPGKYVYCLVEGHGPLELDLLGAVDGTGPVHAIRSDGLAAVVSDAPLAPFDPSTENLAAHARVSELAVRELTVIPIPFGTVFRSELEVHELLRSAGTAFGDVLDSLRGRVEMGIGVAWDRERIVGDLEQDDHRIARLLEEITRDGARSTYFARLRLAHLVEDALERRSMQIVSGVYETLRPLAAAHRPGRLVGDHMIASAAFLVERSQVGAFRDAAAELASRLSPVVTVEPAGPRPASAFASIRLELERAE